jgi:hypothetical protein
MLHIAATSPWRQQPRILEQGDEPAMAYASRDEEPTTGTLPITFLRDSKMVSKRVSNF